MSIVPNRTPTLAEVVAMALDARLGDLHVALPGRVEEYDADEQKINVKPLIQRTTLLADGEEITESIPIIPDVPVVFPRGGGFFLSFPVQKGDLCLLIFNERSIDKYTDGDGDETDPVDTRTHDLSDAVALMGFYPFGQSLSDADSDNLVIGKDGGVQMHVSDDEINLAEKNAAEFVALADKTKTEISALRDSVDSFVNSFNAHTHLAGALVAGPVPVTGTTGTPLPPPVSNPATVGDVAAQKVKAT